LRNEIKPESLGDINRFLSFINTILQGHGNAILQGHGNAILQGHGNAILQGHGNAILQGHGNAILQGHGNAILQGHGNAVSLLKAVLARTWEPAPQEHLFLVE
jgi:hypothetical protein